MERELANLDPSQPVGAAGKFSRREFFWQDFILNIIDLGSHCLGWGEIWETIFGLHYIHFSSRLIFGVTL